MTQPPIDEMPSSKRRVLVVEDDRAARVALKHLLKPHFDEVSVAGTVKEGIAFASSAPNLILLDLMLPDGDGISVLEYVREHHLASQVAVVTGSNDPDRLARVRDLHPDALLTKPLDFAQLLKSLPQV